MFELIFAGNKELNLFAVVLWTLWNMRNNLRLGKLALSLGQVVDFAQDRILERASCNVVFQQSRPHQVAAWKAPDQHAYKVNFDGAIFVKEGLAGLGVVIRNDQGLIMTSLTQQIPLPVSVIAVEVLAAWRALKLTLELGFDKITLEGDTEVLIKSLVTSCNSLAHYGHLTANIHILMSRFSSLSLSHVRRHCNRLAHALARRVSSTPDMSNWMEEIPQNLNSV